MADSAHIPVCDVIALEAGRCGLLRLERIRRIFEAVDGRARLVTWWHGAAADRLLDERHAGLVEKSLRVLQKRGWETAAEVSFSVFGERGSIDVLAGHRSSQAIVVAEVKGSVGSIEELNRMLDTKARLAPRVASERFDFLPRHVARLLILPEDRTVRRVVDRHAATMASVYPARSREVRAWLRRPDRSLSGIWFLSDLRDPHSVDGP